MDDLTAAWRSFRVADGPALETCRCCRTAAAVPAGPCASRLPRRTPRQMLRSNSCATFAPSCNSARELPWRRSSGRSATRHACRGRTGGPHRQPHPRRRPDHQRPLAASLDGGRVDPHAQRCSCRFPPAEQDLLRRWVDQGTPWTDPPPATRALQPRLRTDLGASPALESRRLVERARPAVYLVVLASRLSTDCRPAVDLGL